MTKILVVEDEMIIAADISMMLSALGYDVTGITPRGEDALKSIEGTRPDIVLMDVIMPVMDGIEATKLLQQRFPAIKVLVLSSFHDHESVYAMLQNGAVGYLTKSTLSKDLVETIRATIGGKMVFSRDVVNQLVAPSQPMVDYHLTDRELEVLVLMADGLNMPEIAEKLTISPSTVKYHITNICNKFGVATRSEALVLAAKNNLV